MLCFCEALDHGVTLAQHVSMLIPLTNSFTGEPSFVWSAHLPGLARQRRCPAARYQLGSLWPPRDTAQHRPLPHESGEPLEPAPAPTRGSSQSDHVEALGISEPDACGSWGAATCDRQEFVAAIRARARFPCRNRASAGLGRYPSRWCSWSRVAG